MSKKRITFFILMALILTDVLEAFLQLCFKKSASTQSDFAINTAFDFLNFIFKVAHSPFLWIGFLTVAILFVIWATVLSKIDLSVAVPVASFSYLFVLLISIFILHEKINLLRWLGIGFILCGIVFVSISSHEKEEEKSCSN